MTNEELNTLAKEHGVTPQALLAALVATQKAGSTSEHPSKVQEYWLIIDASGQFETVIAERDIVQPNNASSDDIVIQAYTDSLQAWYAKVQPNPEIVRQSRTRKLTHNEWVDWVRS